MEHTHESTPPAPSGTPETERSTPGEVRINAALLVKLQDAMARERLKGLAEGIFWGVTLTLLAGALMAIREDQ